MTTFSPVQADTRRAVFTQPEMLQGTSELYESVVKMVTSLRTAGFAFGD